MDRIFKRAYPPSPKNEKRTPNSKANPWQTNDPQQLSPTFYHQQPFAPMSVSRQKPEHYQDLADTPVFTTKFAHLGIEQLEDDSQKYGHGAYGSISHSEAKSQGISLHEPAEDFQSHIMLNINRNLNRNFKQSLFQRFKNRLHQVKNIQDEVQNILQQQRQFTITSLQAIADEVEKWTKKLVMPPSSAHLLEQIGEKDKLIASLGTKVNEKDQQIFKLKKQLVDNIQLLGKEQEKNKMTQKTMSKKTVSYQSRSSLHQGCSNCKILQIKLSSTIQQLITSEHQFNSVVTDNEKLQEQIFDIEQKVVGVQIEVQKRLNEYIKSFNNLPIQNHPAELPTLQSQDYLEIVRKLNDENAQLQTKCQKLESDSLRQHEFREWENKLRDLQLDYRRKEASLFQSMTAHQAAKEKLYQKEHEIIVAEENISNKIQQLKKKEQELASWQAILTDSQARQPDNPLLPSVQRRFGGMDNMLIDQMNVNSFGKIQEKYQPVKQIHIQSQKTYERTNSHNVFIPKLPLRDNDPVLPRQRLKTEFYGNEEQGSTPRRPTIGNQVLYTQILKRHEQKNRQGYNLGTGYKNERDYSPIQQRAQKNQPKYKNTMPNSPQNFRESSKNSKMSANKSMRGPQINTTTFERRERTQMNGLSSKLDKLREEIKRQMDAIR